jgi:hypothetical protein
MDRKHLAFVFIVIPDRIGWRVGRLGGQGHAEREGCRLVCGGDHGRETGGRPSRRGGGEGRRGIVECLACVGAVYTAVEGRNEIRQRDHVKEGWFRD